MAGGLGRAIVLVTQYKFFHRGHRGSVVTAVVCSKSSNELTGGVPNRGQRSVLAIVRFSLEER